MRIQSTLTITLLVMLVGLAAILPLTPAAAQDTALPPTPAAPPTATPIPRPGAAQSLSADGMTVDLYFSGLAQGQTGLVYVSGEGLAGARARFLNQLTDCFPGDDGYYCLISTSMEQSTRVYDLDIFGWFADEARTTIHTQVEVGLGKFIRQEVTIPPERAYLIDPEIERGELARMESIFSTFTEEEYWDSTGFALPIAGSELTSPFGAFRTFNDSVQTRHTGWDLRTTLGQPVMATAAGEVAFTGLLDIRGNIVVIDHGYGVFSTYSHLSQVHVTRGQTITKGQIIGTTGNTGRSSGPHFHWEIAVNGVFVDSVQFIQMWLPAHTE